ncbi:MAG: glycosyltransferase [Bacteroidales bacterium]|nr:glycosyltransferase [Bacteroidales bacterium]
MAYSDDMRKPKISVIMGIYNCAATLQESLESLYAQTCQDFEIILCDDGSDDETFAVAYKNQQSHPNIKLLKNPSNMGLNQTLNNCLAVAHGEFIARMDGDDTCSPERFEKELAVLESHPEYAIVSTEMSFFDENGIWGKSNAIEKPQPADFIHRTCFCHAPCLVRRQAYDAVGGYSVNKRLLRVEDYHLWIKMYAKGYRGYNIKEQLYQMRDDRNATGRKKLKYRFNEAYVKHCAISLLNLPLWNYIYCMRPVLVGLIPSFLFNYLHKRSH